jgi:hypothetical protein
MTRYNELVSVVQQAPWATADVLARLRSLEAEGPEAGPPLWESVVMSSGAAGDERVIEGSRRVWEALGPNAIPRSLGVGRCLLTCNRSGLSRLVPQSFQ